jgi:hypothetical protein
MQPGWHVPVVVSTAHYFVADGHALCGKFVNPRTCEMVATRKCRKCADELSLRAARACRKRHFVSKVDALLALSHIAKVDSTRRPKTEHHTYYHHPCHAWHLTSQEEGRSDYQG